MTIRELCRFFLCVFFIQSSLSQAATYVVSSALDSSTTGTLRWAITSANVNPGPDLITFNLTPPYVISPTNALPKISDHNTHVDGGNNPPRVILDGSMAGSNVCLWVEAVTNVVIERIVIRNFADRAIYLQNGTDSAVRGCHIYANLRGIEAGGQRIVIGGGEAG